MRKENKIMKVMKLRVYFEGYYGGYVNEFVLLPPDINGVFFEELKEKTYSDTVYLGEIAGKYSECYGDLDVSIIDLDELGIKEASDLVKKSDFGEFESYFEMIETDFEDDEDEYDLEKVKKSLKQYGVEHDGYMIKTSFVHDKFINQLKEKYAKKFKTITVLEEDYKKAINLLSGNNINHFE